MGSCGNGHFKQDTFQYDGFYRGLVVSNTDSSQLGRVKIRVYGVFGSNIPSDQLPWAVPAHSIFTGAGSGHGYFAVPEVNSEVFVFFEAGDMYQPVYFAEAPNGVKGLPTERTANYPFRKIWKTKNGVVIYIDDSSKEIKMTHPTGTTVTVDATGNITLESIGNITIKGTTVSSNP
jgi:hypothetical protein